MSVYEVVLYQSISRKPINEFILLLSKSTKTKILHLFTLVENYGIDVGMPHVKKIDKDLFEFRIRGREEVRLLSAMMKNQIYILHAFKKKQNKIHMKDIKLARIRLQRL